MFYDNLPRVIVSNIFVIYLILATIPANKVDASAEGVAPRSFGINREKECFWKDNSTCFKYISGSIHYTRIPHQYWEDRLMKSRAAGLNAIQTLIPWHNHEPEPGQFDFSGDNDLINFVETAAKLGLYVILRPGPYICAEMEMGGLPYWLLRDNPHMLLRTSDPTFLARVKSWFDVLLPKIKPYLYINGGPILMIQIENEYGSYYACDRNYTAYLRDLVQSHLTNDTLLYTTDGNSVGYLKCGYIPGVYPTVDFGTQSTAQAVNNSFIAQRNFSGPGPKVNSEYYPGWFDSWGDKAHNTVNSQRTIKTLQDILRFNASVNVYMMHGGTNFGYSSGAEGSDGATGKIYSPIVTSYDYDAPISESGDPMPKLYAIRSLVEDYTGKKIPYPVPNATKKISYGSFRLKKLGSIIDVLNSVSDGFTKSPYPQNAETLGHGYGFILYITKLTFSGSKLVVPTVHDRAYFIRNGVEFMGLLDRNVNTTIQPKDKFLAGDIVHILLENLGRINYGSWINDSKGISNVTLDGHVLSDWIHYPITLENYFKPHLTTDIKNSLSKDTNALPNSVIKRKTVPSASFVPSVYVGTLKTTDVADTFFDPTNWGKGQLLINGFNLGRYWPTMGPQQTLYVPRFYLKNGTSTIMVLELDNPGNCENVDKSVCYASFTNIAQLSKPGTVPGEERDVGWDRRTTTEH